MSRFRSTVLILPGLGNSGDAHWQTLWEKQFDFTRVNQRDWDTPVRTEWVEKIEDTLSGFTPEKILLVGHSLACCTIAYWAQQTKHKIKGALLVAPSDTEASSYPAGTTGFTPMPLNKLLFPSITVTSNNDFYVTTERARYFADAWGSRFVSVGEVGHINAASGIGSWPEGLNYLEELDQ